MNTSNDYCAYIKALFKVLKNQISNMDEIEINDEDELNKKIKKINKITNKIEIKIMELIMNNDEDLFKNLKSIRSE